MSEYTQNTNSVDYMFDGQMNYGWVHTFSMTPKAPVIAKRIFKTLEQAEAFINNPDDSAIEGLILTVVDDDKDDANNGAYFVKSIKKSETGSNGKLVKLSDSNIDASLFTVVSDLPTASADTLNKIYLIEDATGDSGNKYTEYICVETVSGENTTYAWEKLGEYKATINLKDYYKKSETYSQAEVDSKIDVVKNSIPTNISDFTNEYGYIESNTADREIKLRHYNLEGDDEQTNVIDLSFTGITLEYNQRDTASDEYIKNALIIDNDGIKIKKDYNDASEAESNGSLIATEAYVDNAIAGGISNNYLLKVSNEPQTISVTIIDEFNEGCYDRSLLSINGTGLTCAFSKVNTPGNDPVEGSIEITNSKDYINIKPDKDINLLEHSLTINQKAVSLEGHTHNGLEKIAQLEATIATMQQTIVSLQQEIEGLTTGQGIVTPQNIGRYAVTSITGENSDISATKRDENGNVVISLNSITNIAFGDATEIEKENTAQF